MAYTELIKKLRKYKPQSGYAWNCYAAADAIESLEKELQTAVKSERNRIADWLDSDWPADSGEERSHRRWAALLLRHDPDV